MNINDITIGEILKIKAMFEGCQPASTDKQPESTDKQPASTDKPRWTHPLLGKRVLVRTYSAGVHIGTLVSVNPDNAMECHLKDALRLWEWKNGGLSLSVLARDGIKGGRVNRTDEVTLTGAIEYIPTTPKAEATYVPFIEA